LIRKTRVLLRVLCIVVLTTLPPGLAAGEGIPQERTVLAFRTAQPPSIDGTLDDPSWESAVPVGPLYQREPVEGAPASERTEVRILYDDVRLYLGFRCFDTDARRIVANRMRRDDELEEDDNVVVILDTYDDRRGGFLFCTNPQGARWDAILSDEGRSRNDAWDCVWKARSTRDSLGWAAEMAIPFDQLRYAESPDAAWGINIGRTIRRKNEDVYLAPTPQAYGFSGQYRTSNLATLRGLGALRARPRLQIIPYALSATERDFDALDPTEQRTLDSGLDLKYGLGSSLTLDLSLRTDFAQVEADQEQVNLTRFSLFLPEKRDFFLEGAGIFVFGERFESFRGPPPTLLFYSRRIGIQEGHNIPVIGGGKLTGRVGAYEIGLLHMTTSAGNFLDEEEEERFVTDAGEYLDEDDPRLSLVTLVDTVDVDVIDTLRVSRTHYSVMRVRRDILDRSNIGVIAVNRSPGEDTDHNRAAGADINLSLLSSSLNLRGFVARTWAPDATGKDRAGMASLGYRTGALETTASYLDVQENFSPEAGFVPRDDIRRYRGSIRYRPYPKTKWIRMITLGPRFDYFTDQRNVQQTREFEFSAFTNLEIGDWIGVEYSHRFERLDESFDIHEDIEISEGDYEFGSCGLIFFSNPGRKISGFAFANTGGFFNGTRRRFTTSCSLKPSGRLNLELEYGLNRVNLPNGDFTTNRITSRFLYSFTPDLFVRGLVQWNSRSEMVGGNFMLSYRYLPGSDLFLVYNHAWDTEIGFRQQNRSIQLKLSYLWKR